MARLCNVIRLHRAMAGSCYPSSTCARGLSTHRPSTSSGNPISIDLKQSGGPCARVGAADGIGARSESAPSGPSAAISAGRRRYTKQLEIPLLHVLEVRPPNMPRSATWMMPSLPMRRDQALRIRGTLSFTISKQAASLFSSLIRCRLSNPSCFRSRFSGRSSWDRNSEIALQPPCGAELAFGRRCAPSRCAEASRAPCGSSWSAAARRSQAGGRRLRRLRGSRSRPDAPRGSPRSRPADLQGRQLDMRHRSACRAIAPPVGRRRHFL